MKLGCQIKSVKKVRLDDYSVELVFSDGFKGTVFLNHLFSPPKGLSAEVLKGNLFEKCYVSAGALAWPNGLELCPDAIRLWIEEQKVSNLKKFA